MSFADEKLDEIVHSLNAIRYKIKNF